MNVQVWILLIASYVTWILSVTIESFLFKSNQSLKKWKIHFKLHYCFSPPFFFRMWVSFLIVYFWVWIMFIAPNSLSLVSSGVRVAFQLMLNWQITMMSMVQKQGWQWHPESGAHLMMTWPLDAEGNIAACQPVGIMKCYAGLWVQSELFLEGLQMHILSYFVTFVESEWLNKSTKK